MHASIFCLDLGNTRTARDRWRASRALATVLDAVHGFVAFLAIETEDGMVAGLCICVDAPALAEARQVAETWQRARGRHTQGTPGSASQPIIAGEVIVQRGL